MTECYIQDAEGPCHCDDCEWDGDASELEMISDIQERINAGGVVPAGQCPECGALAYLDETPDWARDPVKDAAHDLLAALKGLFEHCAMIHKHWGDGDNTKAANAAQDAAREAIAKAEGPGQ